jgi:hypothetical protein
MYPHGLTFLNMDISLQGGRCGRRRLRRIYRRRKAGTNGRRCGTSRTDRRRRAVSRRIIGVTAGVARVRVLNNPTHAIVLVDDRTGGLRHRAIDKGRSEGGANKSAGRNSRRSGTCFHQVAPMLTERHNSADDSCTTWSYRRKL